MCADTEHDWPTPGQGVDSVKPRQYELLRAYCALAHAVAQVRAEQASLAYPPFVIFIDHFDLMMMRVNEQPTPHKTAGILLVIPLITATITDTITTVKHWREKPPYTKGD